MTELNSVQKFYKNKTIFITGASGFMGKVLMEKLLYSCSDLKEIVILMRPKRGKSEAARVADFVNIPLFHRIVKEKPSMMNKIVAVYGDITKPELALNEIHLKKVLEANLVFHAAASLKLEWTLRPNVLINLTGTKNVIELSKMMPNLSLLVHFSTAFCCCDEDTLGERIYDWPEKPAKLMKLAETCTEEEMFAMQKNFLGVHPNTYTYTKRLAEILVRDEVAKGLPACIVRPSVVIPAYKEPLPGWVDSLNGPAGLMIGAAKGVIRTMLLDGTLEAELIPVDVACSGVILIARDVAMRPAKSNEVEVFNVTNSESQRRTMKYVLETAKEINNETPLQMGLWYPNGDITTNVFKHKVNVALFHWLPAYLIDFLMLCLFQKRFMVHVQTRISQGLEVLQFFTMRNWDFCSQKFKDLNKTLSKDEYKMFFVDTDAVPKSEEREYLKNCLLGARQYILKEPLSTIPMARIQMKIAYFVDRLCKFFFFYSVIKFLLNIFGLMPLVERFLSAFTSTDVTA